MQERRTHSPPLHRRIRVFLLEQMLWFHVLFLLAVLVGVVLNVVRCIDTSVLAHTVVHSTLHLWGTHKAWVFLLTRIGWPPMYWLLQAASCCTPIRYVLWPPREVTMDDVLEEDKKTGVKYPKDWLSSLQHTPRHSPSDHLTTLVTLYTLICFVGSWFVKDASIRS
jgi:hypothetical protein